MCNGLEQDSDIHKGQNGVQRNFAAFASKYCDTYSVDEHKAIKDRLAAEEKEKSAEAGAKSGAEEL